MKVFACLAAAAVSLALLSSGGCASAKKSASAPPPQPKPPSYSVTITTLPPFGKGTSVRTDPIGGIVTAPLDLNELRVVVYCFAGETWWVQPLESQPLTSISKDGAWRSRTHPGNEYAALLVRREYKPPATTQVLPGEGGDVLAVTIHSEPSQPTTQPAVPATSSASRAPRRQRIIQFSGHEWIVKDSGPARVGPGPNLFDAHMVRVDDEGLHLRIAQRDGQWRCAEIISRQTFGYGTYRFELASPAADDLPPQAVLGLFTWSDTPQQFHREIDIELARWSEAESHNAQYVVQPWTRRGNRIRFSLPRGLQNSVHCFTWTPSRVRCWSETVPPAKHAILNEYEFTEDVPTSRDEKVHLNLWLFRGAPPAHGAVEVIIRRFEFEPATEAGAAHTNEPTIGQQPDGAASQSRGPGRFADATGLGAIDRSRSNGMLLTGITAACACRKQEPSAEEKLSRQSG